MAAEIHYIPKYLPPFIKGLLYKNEPEMIIDFPQNIYGLQTVPVVFITNHSKKFPVKNIHIEVLFSSNKIDTILSNSFSISEISSHGVTANFFYIDCSNIIKHELYTKMYIRATARYSVNGKENRFTFSNIRGCSPEHLEINIYKNKFINIYGYATGDMHIHSSISSDQVEFGYPIDVYREVAKFVNLDFLSITDHSYDIDKKEGYWYKKDPELKQWNKILASSVSTDNIEVICGQEVSCGNVKSKNVHLLSIGNRDFIHGNGDSGEKLFKNKPDNFLNSILENSGKISGIFAAAHPLTKISFAEKILLNRGTYSQTDMGKVTHIQFVNSNPWLNYESDLIFFDDILLKYGKKYLIAGSDAHGYFGWCPQMKIPLIKATYNFSNIFSKNRTVVFKHKGEITLEAVKKGNCAITTGNYIVYITSIENMSAEILIHNNNCYLNETLNLTVKFFTHTGSIKLKSVVVKNDFVLKPVYSTNITSPEKFIFCYATLKTENTTLIAVSNVASN